MEPLRRVQATAAVRLARQAALIAPTIVARPSEWMMPRENAAPNARLTAGAMQLGSPAAAPTTIRVRPPAIHRPRWRLGRRLWLANQGRFHSALAQPLVRNTGLRTGVGRNPDARKPPPWAAYQQTGTWELDLALVVLVLVLALVLALAQALARVLGREQMRSRQQISKTTNVPTRPRGGKAWQYPRRPQHVKGYNLLPATQQVVATQAQAALSVQVMTWHPPTPRPPQPT